MESWVSQSKTPASNNPKITQKNKISTPYMHAWPFGQLGSKLGHCLTGHVNIRIDRKREKNGRIVVSAVLAEDRPGRKRDGTTDQYGTHDIRFPWTEGEREGKEKGGMNAQPQFEIDNWRIWQPMITPRMNRLETNIKRREDFFSPRKASVKNSPKGKKTTGMRCMQYSVQGQPERHRWLAKTPKTSQI